MRTKQETILKFEWVARQAQLGLDTIALQSAELRSDRNNRPSIVTYSLNEAKKLPLLGGIQRVVQQMEKEGHVCGLTLRGETITPRIQSILLTHN